MSYSRGGSVVPVLRDLDLQVGAGEFLGVLGPSGSGKSTLLRLIAGLQRPMRGTISVYEKEVSAMGQEEAAAFRLRDVGIVFQFFNLMPMLNVEENVALPLLLSGHSLADCSEQVSLLLRQLKIGEHRSKRVSQLSGGELQRVAIARALIAGPRVVLADEPTGNLDVALGGEIFSMLRDAADARGVSILAFTHDLRVARYAHRIVRLREGRIESDVHVPLGEIGTDR